METQKQQTEESVMLVHPIYGDSLTPKWVADALLKDEGSGWKLKEETDQEPSNKNQKRSI